MAIKMCLGRQNLDETELQLVFKISGDLVILNKDGQDFCQDIFKGGNSTQHSRSPAICC